MFLYTYQYSTYVVNFSITIYSNLSKTADTYHRLHHPILTPTHPLFDIHSYKYILNQIHTVYLQYSYYTRHITVLYIISGTWSDLIKKGFTYYCKSFCRIFSCIIILKQNNRSHNTFRKFSPTDVRISYWIAIQLNEWKCFCLFVKTVQVQHTHIHRHTIT